MLKEAHPEWGCQRISDMLLRGPALPASPSAVAQVLHEAGYASEEVPTRPHEPKVTSFERARPNQLWQTDLFTFILKRQNRRVYLVAFLDDHSRFIVGYGLHASQSTALVLEVLRAAIAGFGTPEEILTDNGTQYVTWRGKSAFTRECEKRGIQQIVASPRRPQTLGKIERFWGTLWRECVETAVFVDLGDARQRIGLFIDHYNFQRPHQGIDGAAPADRFFGAAAEVKRTLAARVAANALELARHGVPKAPFYLTGQVGGQPFSVHAEGERVILTRTDGRQEIDLLPPSPAPEAVSLPAPVCPQGVVAVSGSAREKASRNPRRRALRRWTIVWSGEARPKRLLRKGVACEDSQGPTPATGSESRRETTRSDLARGPGRRADAAASGRIVGSVVAGLLPVGGPGDEPLPRGMRVAAAGASTEWRVEVAGTGPGDRSAEEGAEPVSNTGAADPANRGSVAACRTGEVHWPAAKTKTDGAGAPPRRSAARGGSR